MSANNFSRPNPFFLEGTAGRLFSVYHEPVGAAAPWGNMLVVPPFNEEMNRCRSTVTRQAREFGRLGVGTMVMDLHGTGESDGNYRDASWDLWIENIRQAIAWLDAKPGGCIGLLGIRLGVPLALTALRQEPGKRALIAWQPVVDGKIYFTQFMRIRIAANMDRTDIPKDTTSAMRAALAEGRNIEVAGYEINPGLAAAIENVQLDELLPPESTPVAWFEKGGGAGNTISPASEKLVESWRAAGRSPEVIVFDDPAFWALHERSLAPDLLKKTADWISLLRPRQ